MPSSLNIVSLRFPKFHTNCMEFTKILGLTLLHSERPKLHTILAFLSAIGLRCLVKWALFSGVCFWKLLLFIFYKPGSGCSELTASLFTVSLKFQKFEKYANIFLLKKCEKLLHCKSSIFLRQKISVYLDKGIKQRVDPLTTL